MSTDKKRVKGTIGRSIVVIAMLVFVFVMLGGVEEKSTTQTMKKSASASVVNKKSSMTGKSITNTDVSLTGDERTDTVNIAMTQLGQYEDESAEYRTIYNEWFWEFVNSPDPYTGGKYDKWNWSNIATKDEKVAHAPWSYFFLGWAADSAGCRMTASKNDRGFYVDGDIKRTYDIDGSLGWFLANNRATKLSSTADVVNMAQPGDLVVAKDGEGQHHIAMIYDNDGSGVQTVEGNTGAEHPTVVRSRVMLKGMTKTWEGMSVMYLCRPMYRATAKFHTNGGKITAMPNDGNVWTNVGNNQEGVLYSYKYYEGLEEYNSTVTYLPTEDDVILDGYRFLGWYDNKELSGERITSIPSDQRGNVNYYASWVAVEEDNYSSAVSHSEDGVEITKRSTWTMYEGQSLSKKGNPYIQIEFEIDPSEFYEDNISSSALGAKGCYISDLIPEEFIPIWESVSLNDDNMTLDTKTAFTFERKVFIRFSDTLENKVYKASFIVEIDKTKLSQDYIKGYYTMNTNGATVDASHDSIGSAYFVCDDIHVELSSPRLKYKEHTNDELDSDGIISLSKSAGWTTYNGKYTDEDGNRFIEIEFEVDITGISFDLEELTLIDYIPPEYELMTDSVYVSNKNYLDVTYYTDDRSVECNWKNSEDGIQGNVYYLSLTLKLVMDRVNLDNMKATARLFTNGKTSDVTKSSVGSAIVIIDGSISKLKSPYIDCTGLVNKIHNVVLHTNGGTIAEGKGVTSYVEGSTASLPSSLDIKKDGYIFAGWFDNENLNGEPVSGITVADKGDKEYWAKWIKEGEVVLLKDAERTTYNGADRDENGNPYILTTISVDLSTVDFSAAKYNGKTPYIVDDIPAEYELLEDTVMGNDANLKYSFEDNQFVLYFHEVELTNDVYLVEFKTKLNLDKAKGKLQENDGTVYTNGKSIDIKTDSSGSVYFEYGPIKVEKDSPKVQLPVPYDVKLNTNGGRFLPGREVTRYFAGEIKELPGEFDITKAGFKFVGWYDNEGLTGSPVTFIPSSATGNKQYWAKWEENNVIGSVVAAVKDGISFSKTAYWTKYNGEEYDKEGNPYVRIVFDVDFTKYVGSKDQPFTIVDKMPSNYEVIWATSVFSPKRNNIEYEHYTTSADKSDNIKVKIKDIENISYTFTFVAKLNLDTVANEYLIEEKPINTNGATIDSNANSIGSSSLNRGDTILMKLASPTVCCKDLDNSNGELGLKKSADWTTYNGKQDDGNQNPYYEIEFEADLRNANLYQMHKVTSVDVIIMMDFSGSMSWDGAGEHMIQHAKGFVNQFLSYDKIDNKRIAVGTFANEVTELVNLDDAISSNAKEINKKIDQKYDNGDGIYGDDDMQSCTVWAQRQFLKHSNADKKILMVISDGNPVICNLRKNYAGPDLVDVYPALNDQSYSYAQILEQTRAQIDYAKANVPNLEVISLGLNLDYDTRNFLKSV